MKKAVHVLMRLRAYSITRLLCKIHGICSFCFPPKTTRGVQIAPLRFWSQDYSPAQTPTSEIALYTLSPPEDSTLTATSVSLSPPRPSDLPSRASTVPSRPPRRNAARLSSADRRIHGAPRPDPPPARSALFFAAIYSFEKTFPAQKVNGSPSR